MGSSNFSCYRNSLIPGPVFGSKDNFHGLAIFLDTYPNDETTEVGPRSPTEQDRASPWSPL